jgi:hypothetical protein
VGRVRIGVARGYRLWRAGDRLRQLVLNYLGRHRNDLPEVVLRVREHFRESFSNQISDWPRDRMTAELQMRGVTHIADPAHAPIAALRSAYIDARTSELTEFGSGEALARAENEVALEPGVNPVLADSARSPQEILRYLHDRGRHLELDLLTPAQLREYLLDTYTHGSWQFDEAEFAGVQDAVVNWQRMWVSPKGEAFLPLLASALGIQVRVVQYRRRNPLNSRQWENVAPFRLRTATVGCWGGPVVYVYYNGDNHYNGSGPPSGGGGAGTGRGRRR